MRIEAVLEITSNSVATNRGENCVMVKGYIHDSGHMKEDAVEPVDVTIRLHTGDGQSPLKLGQKLKIVITDE